MHSKEDLYVSHTTIVFFFAVKVPELAEPIDFDLIVYVPPLLYAASMFPLVVAVLMTPPF